MIFGASAATTYAAEAKNLSEARCVSQAELRLPKFLTFDYGCINGGP